MFSSITTLQVLIQQLVYTFLLLLLAQTFGIIHIHLKWKVYLQFPLQIQSDITFFPGLDFNLHIHVF